VSHPLRRLIETTRAEQSSPPGRAPVTLPLFTNVLEVEFSELRLCESALLY
jgi:hypothetical protein